jgi:hypothetical protein
MCKVKHRWLINEDTWPEEFWPSPPWRVSGCGRPCAVVAAELAAIQKADSELWAPAVKASGFTPEQ